MWFASEPSFWMPTQASTHAELVDNVYYFLYWASVVSFVAIIVVGAIFLVRYRNRGDRDEQATKTSTHNTMLEVTWTLPVVVVSVIAFYFGMVGYIDLHTPPDDAYEIQVTGYKWAWQFTYPNGHTDANLHVPRDRPVKLVMTSDDVIHSFFVPAFRVKQDVVPGRYTKAWFEATQDGEFQVFCTEYCGTKHAEMLAKVIVYPANEFEEWLKSVGDRFKDMPPAEAGELLVQENGCKQCHSLDGSKGVGPSFKGAWGTTRELADGSAVEMDENYVRNSILNPQADVVAGYPPVMPTFQGRLKDEEISMIIAYLKTLQ